MNNMYTRSSCRLCEGPTLTKVLKYNWSVPVDNYRPRMHKSICEQAYPMDLYLCKSCGHAQLADVVDPNILYGDYIYKSSSSPDLKKHFINLYEYITSSIALNEDNLIIDVGCNDGLLLEIFSKNGYRVLGIDPSNAALAEAKKRGLKTIESFLTEKLARKVRQEFGSAKLVTATNVFSHADDMKEFIGGVHGLLSEGGYFIFEVSYLKDLLFSGVWDYVYHEHLAHHSIKPIRNFLKSNGFHLHAAESVAVKGGSLRCIAIKTTTNTIESAQVAKLLMEEELLGLHEISTFERVAGSRQKLKSLTAKVIRSLPNDSLICSYGASATTTVLSQELDYANKINFIVDDNPERQNTLSPGFLVPVLSSTKMRELNPALIILSAWRFKENILTKCAELIKSGSKIYIPLPYPHIISNLGETVLTL